MADELTIHVSATLDNGDLERAFTPDRFQVDQTTQGADWRLHQIPAADTALSFTDIGTFGWCFMRNTDSSNYVKYGPTSGGAIVPFGRIEAGEVAALRLEPGITFRAEANGGAVELDILIIED